MVVVGYDLPSSEAAVKLAESTDGLWATVGVHPHDASGVNGYTIEALRRLAASERVVGIGETGLDFYRDLSPREAQESSFRRHLELAAELRLPAVVHCREAQERVLAMLRECAGLALIWHSFDGAPAHAADALSLGALLGFNGMLTYPRNRHLPEIAATVPLDRMLLETDCPYLAPEPRRSHDNEPANLPLVADAVARACRIPAADVIRATAANAGQVFPRLSTTP
jgi:TatD DNase family protein